MDTILKYDGTICYLSDEVYRVKLKKTNEYSAQYDGKIVRKISGVDGAGMIGYHFSAGYVTVHLLESPVATFIGVRIDELERIL